MRPSRFGPYSLRTCAVLASLERLQWWSRTFKRVRARAFLKGLGAAESHDARLDCGVCSSGSSSVSFGAASTKREMRLQSILRLQIRNEPKAQQGARANAGTCHESCRNGFRNDLVRKGTPRAKSRRGSSLTLGRMKADWISLMMMAVVMAGVAAADFAFGTGGYLGALGAACALWAALYFMQRRRIAQIRAQLAAMNESERAIVLARLDPGIRRKLEPSGDPRKNA